MSLDRKEVEKIAHLARIAISEDEIPRYVRELSNILELARQLDVVDTADIVPMAHPLDGCQRMRADRITEGNRRKAFQGGAPLVEAGLYLVPKVIE